MTPLSPQEELYDRASRPDLWPREQGGGGVGGAWSEAEALLPPATLYRPRGGRGGGESEGVLCPRLVVVDRRGCLGAWTPRGDGLVAPGQDPEAVARAAARRRAETRAAGASGEGLSHAPPLVADRLPPSDYTAHLEMVHKSPSPSRSGGSGIDSASDDDGIGGGDPDARRPPREPDDATARARAAALRAAALRAAAPLSRRPGAVRHFTDFSSFYLGAGGVVETPAPRRWDLGPGGGLLSYGDGLDALRGPADVSGGSGETFAESIGDAVRREMEAADAPQGFVVVTEIGGGGGFGALGAEVVREVSSEAYRGKSTMCFDLDLSGTPRELEPGAGWGSPGPGGRGGRDDPPERGGGSAGLLAAAAGRALGLAGALGGLGETGGLFVPLDVGRWAGGEGRPQSPLFPLLERPGADAFRASAVAAVAIDLVTGPARSASGLSGGGRGLDGLVEAARLGGGALAALALSLPALPRASAGAGGEGGADARQPRDPRERTRDRRGDDGPNDGTPWPADAAAWLCPGGLAPGSARGGGGDVVVWRGGASGGGGRPHPTPLDLAVAASEADARSGDVRGAGRPLLRLGHAVPLPLPLPPAFPALFGSPPSGGPNTIASHQTEVAALARLLGCRGLARLPWEAARMGAGGRTSGGAASRRHGLVDVLAAWGLEGAEMDEASGTLLGEAARQGGGEGWEGEGWEGEGWGGWSSS